MDKDELYAHPRWTEAPKPTVLGTVRFSDEEEKRHAEILDEFIRRDRERLQKQ